MISTSQPRNRRARTCRARARRRQSSKGQLANTIDPAAEANDQFFSNFLGGQYLVIGDGVFPHQLEVGLAESLNRCDTVGVPLQIDVGSIGRQPDLAASIECVAPDLADCLYHGLCVGFVFVLTGKAGLDGVAFMRLGSWRSGSSVEGRSVLGVHLPRCV